MPGDCQTQSSRPKRGFTLVELLVVIGIIVLLAGILLPVLTRAMRQANRARTASDLNAIASALEAYQHDFGDYPRIIYTMNTPMNGTGSGAEVLGRALLGTGGQDGVNPVGSPTWAYNPSTTYYPGQVVMSGGTQYVALAQSTGVSPAAGSPSWEWVTVGQGNVGGGFDGADGPGFRIRLGGMGKVYGPYLQPDKFKTRGLAIADSFGNPILYYPANPAHPVITQNTASTSGGVGVGSNYVSTAPGVTTPNISSSAPTGPCQSLYNYSDNDTGALQSTDSNIPNAFPDITVMYAMLGDYALQGYIGTGETPATTAQYLLWSAGPDGQFGCVHPDAADVSSFKSAAPSAIKNLVTGCDDVTNFTFAQ